MLRCQYIQCRLWKVVSAIKQKKYLRETLNKYQAEGVQTVVDIVGKVAGVKTEHYSRLLPTVKSLH